MKLNIDLLFVTEYKPKCVWKITSFHLEGWGGYVLREKLKLIKFITASAIIMSKTYSLLNDTTFKYMPANLRHFTLTYSPLRETSIFSSYFFRGLL